MKTKTILLITLFGLVFEAGAQTNSVRIKSPEARIQEFLSSNLNIKIQELLTSNLNLLVNPANKPLDQAKFQKSLRFLSDNDKARLYLILLENKNGLVTYLNYLFDYCVFTKKPRDFSDFYVKIVQESEGNYMCNCYVTFGSLVDYKWNWFGVSLPMPPTTGLEAAEGGNAGRFIEYDLLTEDTYMQNYPFKALEEVLKAAKYIAENYDYDFQKAFGLRCKIRPGKTGGVCDDYANASWELLAGRKDRIPAMTRIWKVTSASMNHAWNEVEMDSRILYFNATWFDINKIGDDGYSVTLPEDAGYDYNYRFVTFDRAIFDRGFSGKARYHYSGGDAIRTLVWSR